MKLIDSQIEREDLLLTLMYYAREVNSRTKLQKLIFLIQNEESSPINESIFNYEPYLYGPYSQELYNTTLDLLTKGDIIEEDYIFEKGEEIITAHAYRITPKGLRKARRKITRFSPEMNHFIRSIVLKFNYQYLVKILEYVYKEYPEMTEKYLDERYISL